MELFEEDSDDEELKGEEGKDRPVAIHKWSDGDKAFARELNEQELSDTLLILVGQNSDALSKVAKRRLWGEEVRWCPGGVRAPPGGGRLLVLCLDQAASKYEEVLHGDEFLWCPPPHRPAVSQSQRVQDVRAQLPDTWETTWISNGPTVTELRQGETCEVSDWAVRVKAQENNKEKIVWEMSGKVIEVDHEGVLRRPRDPEGTELPIDTVDVTDPQFLPLKLPDIKCFLFWAVYICFGLVLYLLGESYGATWDLPLQRLIFAAVIALPFGQQVRRLWGLAATGREAYGPVHHGVSAVIVFGVFGGIGVLPIGSKFLSLFWVCTLGTTVFLLIEMPMHYCLTCCSRERTQPMWSVVAAITSFGGWIAFHGVSIGYVALLNISPITANLFLPICTGITEYLFVQLISYFYHYYFFKDASKQKGDQFGVLAFISATIHAESENTRLGSVFESAIMHGGYTWITAVFFGVIFNLLTRTHWWSYFHWRMRDVLHKCCACVPERAHCGPSHVTRLCHNECKKVIGYTPFIAPIAIFVMRAIRGFSPFYLSMPALMVLITYFVAEIIEDCIIKYLSSHGLVAPLPKPTSMQQLKLHDTKQLYTFGRKVPADVRSEEGNVTTTGLCTEREREEDSIQVRGTGVSRSLLLHGTRSMSLWEHGVMMCPGTIMIVVQLQLTLVQGTLQGPAALPSVQKQIA